MAQDKRKPEGGKYVIQDAPASRCPKCRLAVQLLCSEWCLISSDPMFYVCWSCKTVFQVGVGEVEKR